MKKITMLIVNMLAALSIVVFSTGASAQLGSSNKDLVFTPVAPCRIMDTRNPGSLSGILAAGSTRAFVGGVLSSYAIQGGSATTCNVLEGIDLAALQLNFTVVNPSTGGYITAFPADAAAPPLAATMNFNAGDIKGNNANLKLNQTAGQFQFKVFTTSQTHLVADVVGYYARPKATALECYATTPVIGEISTPLNGRFWGQSVANGCNLGFVNYGASCSTSSLLVNISSVDSYNVSSVCVANHSTNTETVTATQRCCRVPGNYYEP